MWNAEWLWNANFVYNCITCENWYRWGENGDNYRNFTNSIMFFLAVIIDWFIFKYWITIVTSLAHSLWKVQGICDPPPVKPYSRWGVGQHHSPTHLDFFHLLRRFEKCGVRRECWWVEQRMEGLYDRRHLHFLSLTFTKTYDCECAQTTKTYTS